MTSSASQTIYGDPLVNSDWLWTLNVIHSPKDPADKFPGAVRGRLGKGAGDRVTCCSQCGMPINPGGCHYLN